MIEIEGSSTAHSPLNTFKNTFIDRTNDQQNAHLLYAPSRLSNTQEDTIEFKKRLLACQEWLKDEKNWSRVFTLCIQSGRRHFVKTMVEQKSNFDVNMNLNTESTSPEKKLTPFRVALEASQQWVLEYLVEECRAPIPNQVDLDQLRCVISKQKKDGSEYKKFQDCLFYLEHNTKHFIFNVDTIIEFQNRLTQHHDWLSQPVNWFAVFGLCMKFNNAELIETMIKNDPHGYLPIYIEQLRTLPEFEQVLSVCPIGGSDRKTWAAVLKQCIESGKRDFVESMIQKQPDFDVNAKLDTGLTPLMQAVAAGQYPLVQYFHETLHAQVPQEINLYKFGQMLKNQIHSNRIETCIAYLTNPEAFKEQKRLALEEEKKVLEEIKALEEKIAEEKQRLREMAEEQEREDQQQRQRKIHETDLKTLDDYLKSTADAEQGSSSAALRSMQKNSPSEPNDSVFSHPAQQQDEVPMEIMQAMGSDFADPEVLGEAMQVEQSVFTQKEEKLNRQIEQEQENIKTFYEEELRKKQHELEVAESIRKENELKMAALIKKQNELEMAEERKVLSELKELRLRAQRIQPEPSEPIQFSIEPENTTSNEGAGENQSAPTQTQSSSPEKRSSSPRKRKSSDEKDDIELLRHPLENEFLEEQPFFKKRKIIIEDPVKNTHGRMIEEETIIQSSQDPVIRNHVKQGTIRNMVQLFEQKAKLEKEQAEKSQSSHEKVEVERTQDSGEKSNRNSRKQSRQ